MGYLPVQCSLCVVASCVVVAIRLCGSYLWRHVTQPNGVIGPSLLATGALGYFIVIFRLEQVSPIGAFYPMYSFWFAGGALLEYLGLGVC